MASPPPHPSCLQGGGPRAAGGRTRAPMTVREMEPSPHAARMDTVAVTRTGIPEHPSRILFQQLHCVQVASVQPGKEHDPSSPRVQMQHERCQVLPPRRGSARLKRGSASPVTRKPCSGPKRTLWGNRLPGLRSIILLPHVWEASSARPGQRGLGNGAEQFPSWLSRKESD